MFGQVVWGGGGGGREWVLKKGVGYMSWALVHDALYCQNTFPLKGGCSCIGRHFNDELYS